MKFCMIATFYPPYGFGGDANFVHHLALELTARGHEVDVVHCRDSYRTLGGATPVPSVAAEDDRVAGDDRAARVEVHGLESRFGALSPLATHQTGRPLFKTKQLRRILAKPYDVIHYHNPSLVGGPKLLQYGRALKLYTFHEYWLVCPTNLLLRDGREPCEKRSCVRCTIRQGRPPQWWRRTSLLRRSLAHVDAFFSPSRYAIGRHAELGLKAPIVHLPTFVPDGEPVMRAPQADPYFFFAGRLEHAKGPQTLIEPFRRFGRARLLVAGAGAEEKRLRELAAGSDRTELVGHVPIDALRRLYRNAVAVVVPSLTFELFPLVLLEAFREGTPVIVRNRGSLPEVVADSSGGLVYDDEDEMLAHAARLLDDPEARDALGESGRKAFRTRWSASAHVERYLGVIERLRGSRNGSGSTGAARAEAG